MTFRDAAADPGAHTTLAHLVDLRVQMSVWTLRSTLAADESAAGPGEMHCGTRVRPGTHTGGFFGSPSNLCFL